MKVYRAKTLMPGYKINKKGLFVAVPTKKLTELAFTMAKMVWEEVIIEDKNKCKGKLFFCIGGINIINPFSAKSIKNEIKNDNYARQSYYIYTKNGIDKNNITIKKINYV